MQPRHRYVPVDRSQCRFHECTAEQSRPSDMAGAAYAYGYAELILFAVGVHLLFGSLLLPLHKLLASFALPGSEGTGASTETAQQTREAIEEPAADSDINNSSLNRGVITHYGYPFLSPASSDTSHHSAQRLHSWLEDLSHRNVKDFIAEEMKFTESFFATSDLKINDRIDAYSKQMDSVELLLDYKEPPIHKGSAFFYTQRGSLYVVGSIDKSGSSDPPEVVVEASQERPPRGYWVSDDGKKVAYAYTQSSSSGSSEGEESYKALYIGIRDVCTLEDSASICVDIGRDLCALSLSWFTYSSYLQGFFYTMRGGVHFHLLNSDPADDVLVREFPTGDDEYPEHHCDVHTSCDSHYLIIELFRQETAQRTCDLEDMEVSYGEPTSVDSNKVFFIDLLHFVAQFKAHQLRSAAPGAAPTAEDRLSVAKGLLCCRLVDKFKHRFQYISNIEDDFWFRTNFGAANFRIVRITIPRISQSNTNLDIGIPMHVILDPSNLREWVPEAADGSALVSASIAAHTVLVLTYFKDNSHDILLYDLAQLSASESEGSGAAGDNGSGIGSGAGQVRPVATLPHPPCGSISAVTCGFSSPHIFYKYSSFDDPGSTWHALVSRDSYSGSIEISFDCYSSCKDALGALFGTGVEGEPVDLEVLREELRSTDTYNAPAGRGPALWIFGRRDVLENSDEQHPCLLYTYGGFGVSATPAFSLPIYVFARSYRGLFCIVSASGGGERGPKWAGAGRNKNKERSVSDVVAAAEFLIHNEFTNKNKLALLAEGHGALLAMSAVNRCPWLFAACGCVSGIFDVLRYHHFRASGCGTDGLDDSLDSWSSYSTVGSASAAVQRGSNDILISKIWYSEFGCSDESQYERERLRQYSPLHGVVKDLIEVYPAMLLYCSEDDTAPPPQHSLKMIAELRAAAFDSQPKAPQLLLAETRKWRCGRRELRRHATLFAFLCAFIEAQSCTK